MKDLTRENMMNNESNFCIVSVNNKDDILFIGTKEDCISVFHSVVNDDNNNDVPDCYTIADYEFYSEM
jgi:hypothetical protein